MSDIGEKALAKVALTHPERGQMIFLADHHAEADAHVEGRVHGGVVDVAGAREIGGVADNVIFIRRDPDRQSYAQNAAITPMCISIRKQRNFDGALGDCEGWFHRDLKQYNKDQFINAPIRYLPDDAFEEISAYKFDRERDMA